jgi:hypothetical protein
MAKKVLKDPSEGNKNMKRGISVLLNSTESIPNNDSFEEADDEKYTHYNLKMPQQMMDKLKYDIAKNKKSSIKELILEAIQQYYKI